MRLDAGLVLKWKGREVWVEVPSSTMQPNEGSTRLFGISQAGVNPKIPSISLKKAPAPLGL